MTTAVVETLAGLGYCAEVLRGEVACCVSARLAVERHVYDLGPELAGELVGLIRAESPWHPDNAKVAPASARGYWFDNEGAWKAINYIEENCKHWKGEFAEAAFLLEPWQEFVIAAVFGWMDGPDHRRYRNAWVEVPRKNGKTTLAAAVGLYCLDPEGDGEPGAEVYSAAIHKEQAREVWDCAYQMVLGSPELQERITPYRVTLLTQDERSKFTPLSRNTKGYQGKNPSCSISDEVHVHPTGEIISAMRKGMSARKNPLQFMITTAGDEKPGTPYDKEHKHADKVTTGVIQHDAYFALIYELDDGADWRDQDEWYKVNPSLGVSKHLRIMVDDFKLAQTNPSAEREFLRFDLDKRISIASKWMRMEDWNACPIMSDATELRGKPCHGGVDCSSTEDLTAFCLAFPWDDGRIRVKSWYWLPGANAYERWEKHGVPYPKWIEDGHIITTGTNTLDTEAIWAYIEAEILPHYNIVDIGLDPAMAGWLFAKLDKVGIEAYKHQQGWGSMSEPILHTQRMIRRQPPLLIRDGNPVTDWCVSNTAVWTNVKKAQEEVDTGDVQHEPNNYRFDKANSDDKIDGTVALTMAVGRCALIRGERATSVYEERDLFEFEL